MGKQQLLAQPFLLRYGEQVGSTLKMTGTKHPSLGPRYYAADNVISPEHRIHYDASIQLAEILLVPTDS